MGYPSTASRPPGAVTNLKAPTIPSQQTIPAIVPGRPTKPDPFYGHKSISLLCARYITHLFEPPKDPPPSSTRSSLAPLPQFIAYALFRTKLHPSIIFTALIFITRLKFRFPSQRGVSGRRLFLVAFMVASKVVDDVTFSNKAWTVVGQGVFSLPDLNHMEREVCSFLQWDLHVSAPMLRNFEATVKQDFSETKETYPTYPFSMVSERPIEPMSPAVSSAVREERNALRAAIIDKAQQEWVDSYLRPPSSPITSSHAVTSPSHPYSLSPASSASPATPVGEVNNMIKIHGVDSSPPQFTMTNNLHISNSHPLKEHMYSGAIPVAW